jgi:hypothetical protein
MKISATKSAKRFTRPSGKILFLAVVMSSSCGKNSDEVDSSTSTLAIANDSSLTAGVANANYSDALAASTSQGASTTLALSENEDDKSAVTRACVEDGVNAVVQISSTIEKSKTVTTPRANRTIEHSITGSSSMKRTWSNTTGTAVTCNSEKSAAQISWASPDNLKLEAEFERSRAREMKITTPKFEKDFSGSFKSSGKRTLIWGASSTSADTADSYFRTHTATMESTREMTISNDNGVKKEIQLQVATKEGAPLIVSVERSVSGNAVLSRTIVSGTLVTQKDVAKDVEEGSAEDSGDGSIETTYQNLKVDISDGECEASSGSASIAFKDSAGTTIKAYELSIDSSGDPQLKDSAGVAVEGFELDGCDPEDMKI